MNLVQKTDLCDRWLKAWTGNDPEKLLSFYASDIFYSDPANPNGINGRPILGKYLKALLAKNPDWIWERRELMETEKGFVLKWRAKLINGITFEGLDIVEISGDKISRNEVYFDTAGIIS